MHLLLLVWKTSGYYNTSQRLVVCIRKLCNTIIRQAKVFLDGDMIFELIESNKLKDVMDMLHITLRMIGRFKSTYFDYKVRTLTAKDFASRISIPFTEVMLVD